MERAERKNEISEHHLSHLNDSQVYSQTQTDPAIMDGDILVLGKGRVGIMVSAWPVVVMGETGGFHTLESGVTWEAFENGKYAQAVARAYQIVKIQEDRLRDTALHAVCAAIDLHAQYMNIEIT